MRIQPSIVTDDSSRLLLSGTVTTDPGLENVTPAKLNPCPTLAGPKVTSFPSTPLLPPAISIALPSEGHQLTRPEGAGVQIGAVTVKPLVKMTTSLPVVNVTDRVPVAAAESMFSSAVADVAEFTVSDITMMPEPKLAVVTP